jgi:hypothetical protein
MRLKQARTNAAKVHQRPSPLIATRVTASPATSPIRRVISHELQSAETGPSMDRDRTPGVDPLRSA